MLGRWKKGRGDREEGRQITHERCRTASEACCGRMGKGDQTLNGGRQWAGAVEISISTNANLLVACRWLPICVRFCLASLSFSYAGVFPWLSSAS